jgi:hypothetical protein
VEGLWRVCFDFKPLSEKKEVGARHHFLLPTWGHQLKTAANSCLEFWKFENKKSQPLEF